MATILFKEIAEFLRVSYRATRLPSTLCFTSASLVGGILTVATLDLRMLWVLMFSVFSTSFAFIMNDLSDAELDRSAGAFRNPVSTGELSSRLCLSLATSFLLASLVTLSFLSVENRLLGLALILLYFTYSWLVRAKARPVLDVSYHGLCLAILAAIGYLEYASFDTTCLLFASLVFLLSAASQLLQEVRDYEGDKKMLRTTTTLLGRRASLILCLIFLSSALAIFSFLLFYEAFPPEILLLSPLAYPIITPIVRAVRKEGCEDEMLEEIRRRRLILIAISITFLIVWKGTQIGF